MVDEAKEYRWNRQCTATAKQTGEQCRRRAKPGLAVCYKHGGNTKAAKAKSERWKQEESAKRKLAQLNVPPEDHEHPAQILLQQMQWSHAIATALAPQATEEGPESVIWEVWSNERERAARIAEKAARAGVAERMLDLYREEGQRMAVVLMAFTEDLLRAILALFDAERQPRAMQAITRTFEDQAPQLLGQHLRALSPGGAEEPVLRHESH